mmetsp:Transcript_4401/g.16668  ORF Transcript_4401/g.16668 Transcript_4401/m.16668 type:complete len:202 (-) Transcript_4401:391-996(-)
MVVASIATEDAGPNGRVLSSHPPHGSAWASRVGGVVIAARLEGGNAPQERVRGRGAGDDVLEPADQETTETGAGGFQGECSPSPTSSCELARCGKRRQLLPPLRLARAARRHRPAARDGRRGHLPSGLLGCPHSPESGRRRLRTLRGRRLRGEVGVARCRILRRRRAELGAVERFRSGAPDRNGCKSAQMPQERQRFDVRM